MDTTPEPEIAVSEPEIEITPVGRDALKEIDELRGRIIELELGIIDAAKLSMLALKAAGFKIVFNDQDKEKGN
jgi:hypothetical protein